MVEYKKVLLCTDFSEDAGIAFFHALDLAKKHHAWLYIFHVPHSSYAYCRHIVDEHVAEGAISGEAFYSEEVKKKAMEALKEAYEEKLGDFKDYEWVVKSGAPDMEIGDVIQVTGNRSSFNDEVQLNNTTVAILETGGDEPPRTAITAASLNANMDQGELVTVTGFTVTSVDGIDGFDNHNVNGTDLNGDAMVLRVDSRTGIGSADWTVGTTYTVTGVASRFRATFQLKPRMPDDVVAGATASVRDVWRRTSTAPARPAGNTTMIQLSSRSK